MANPVRPPVLVVKVEREVARVGPAEPVAHYAKVVRPVSSLVGVESPVTVVARVERPVSSIVGATQVIGQEGPSGQSGPVGPQGPRGLSGSAVGGFYRHVQDVASATWVIPHNLGFNPGGVSVLDSAGTNVVGDIVYSDANTVTLNFSAPFAGTANLS